MFIPRKRLFWAVGLGHMTNDTLNSMGTVVLAFLSATIIPMTNTQIGLAISAGQLLGAASQPFFGIRADRTGGRWLASGGLAIVAGLFMVSLLIAQMTGQYWLMFIPFVLRTLGSGALHPVGSLHSAESDPEYTASNMSIFFFLGQSGLALGPALAGYLLDAANTRIFDVQAQMLGLSQVVALNTTLTPILLFGLVAIPPILWMMIAIPGHRNSNESVSTPKSKTDTEQATANGFTLLPFLILGTMVILRGLAQPGSVGFIPVLFQQKGWDPAAYGLITSFFWIASGISGIVFGQLADRFDRRRVMTVSMLLSAPAFFALPLLDGAGAFLAAVAAGGFSGGSHSIIVVMAQELLPARKGFASGAILGFIFGTGALGGLVIGGVSDLIGLRTVFQIVAVTTVISGLLALLLPVRQPISIEVE